MDKKDSLKITSGAGSVLESSFEAKDGKYLVITEYLEKASSLVTRIYLKGQVVETRRSPLEARGGGAKSVRDFVKKHHELAVSLVKSRLHAETKQASEYVAEIKELLGKNRYEAAHNRAREALESHPDDLFLNSYYGYLEAKSGKNPKRGVAICKQAIDALKQKVLFGAEFFYPVLYLNLGRAYLESGRRRDAVESFRKGISMDVENRELLWELRKMGMRKQPMIPFLSRSNPFNKYLGLLRSRIAR